MNMNNTIQELDVKNQIQFEFDNATVDAFTVDCDGLNKAILQQTESGPKWDKVTDLISVRLMKNAKDFTKETL